MFVHVRQSKPLTIRQHALASVLEDASVPRSPSPERLTHVQEQQKLRDELLTFDTDSPTMDELNALPYLDMVVSESLRLHAPVPTTIRVPIKDDVIPVSAPFTDRNGDVQDSIKYVDSALYREELEFVYVSDSFVSTGSTREAQSSSPSRP